ncbi:MAG: hypothetical protein SOX72_05415 [Oscillospiraceae bacterium]|nr:hypothetical protein [Oscillospiraceae bacterium]MDY4191638.1 hypothetical protein [Oscillospiraceae bacterium]
MKKSVYSLVLMDDVVEAVDRMAYAMNTSRSNLINQILAEHVSMVTPEKQMQAVFQRIEALMGPQDQFQIQFQPSDSMLSIRSALRYKYKPTIRYSVLLYRGLQEDAIGELRVAFRTQNGELIDALVGFFTLWARLEEKYLGETCGGRAVCRIDEGRYTRQLRLAPGRAWSSEEIARDISGYIEGFDRCLKCYFAHLDDPAKAAPETEKIYKTYLKPGSVR